MSAWTVVPSLLSLRAEFNAISPGRDKGADGTIGDTAHTSASDHTPDEDSSVLRDHDADHKNEVHALDIDSSGPWPASGTQKQRFHAIVMRIIALEKAKWLSADDVCRLEYVIWDRKIYSRSRDFAPRDYTGSDPHTNHAHFSGRYLTRSENDTRPWGVHVILPPAQPQPQPEWSDMATKEEVKQAFREVLVERRPYFLTRLSDRGWSDLSVDGKLDYMFESLVGGAAFDNDGNPATPDVAASVQARLERIENMLEQLTGGAPGS